MVHRVEVRPRPGQPDPLGDAACREAATLGLSRPPRRIDAAAVYLIEGELGEPAVRRLAEELLADPLTETVTLGAAAPVADALVEVHPLPGVMDPDAEAVERAVRALLDVGVRVRTARRYDLHGTDQATARQVAERALANTVIHAVHERPHHPESFPRGTILRHRPSALVIEDMDDRALERFSRDAHLFLSLEELRAIQVEYRRLGRDPQEIELETMAQTWSEHCVHKTMRATIRYREGGAAPVTIQNLFKSTIVAATTRLIEDGIDWCLSVFSDNAGVIAFDDEHAVCFKVETHNHPSAIEPYGGAATGIGGCIRDIIGTGLGAKPVASTDVFCVAHPDHGPPPRGCLHPRRILTQVVAGVRDYGNRMGIPTLNGAVWFDDDYVGNPLVFCGCVGVMPAALVRGQARAGDRIVALGGRTGRDGIHGATFSSAELSDTHADEFSHAVQIGNPVTQKKLLDAVLQARDHTGGPLYHAITDCGAGGFSSAVGEMGAELGADVDLAKAGLKYDGLSPTEIWISEAQERMVLAVPPESMDLLRGICRLHEVELFDLGHFGTPGRELILKHRQSHVGRLSMEFLHEGRPETVREAEWSPRRKRREPGSLFAAKREPGSLLRALLAHPNIASKRWIIRQYDHEVQGGSVIKPLVGPAGEGPSDAAVITPVLGSSRGLAIGNGLCTLWSDDPYQMSLAAIDECVRNLVCVGADPSRIALLDNFCWPGCHDPRRLGELVRAARGCHDGALAYRAPFISGKDSLNNQFSTDDGRTIEIPPTLLISGIGIVHDVRSCVTMDAKAPGNLLVLVGPPTRGALGRSHHDLLFGTGDSPLPEVDLRAGPAAAALVHRLIRDGLVRSCHDLSDGGLLVAATEMAFAGGLGLELRLPAGPGVLFSEEPSRYLLELAPRDLDRARAAAKASKGLAIEAIGAFDDSGRLHGAGVDEDMNELLSIWLKTLDW